MNWSIQRTHTTQFEIDSPSTLLDPSITIKVTGLPPKGKAIIRVHFCDDLKQRWESWAEFIADEQGIVDLRTETPIDGTYVEPDAMGLSWSIQSQAVEVCNRPLARTRMKDKWTAHVDIAVNRHATVPTVPGAYCRRAHRAQWDRTIVRAWHASHSPDKGCPSSPLHRS